MQVPRTSGQNCRTPWNPHCLPKLVHWGDDKQAQPLVSSERTNKGPLEESLGQELWQKQAPIPLARGGPSHKRYPWQYCHR